MPMVGNLRLSRAFLGRLLTFLLCRLCHGDGSIARLAGCYLVVRGLCSPAGSAGVLCPMTLVKPTPWVHCL